MMAASLAFVLAAAVVAQASKLPSFPAGEGGAQQTVELQRSGQWWVQVGDSVYHAPPASSGLSESIGDYYYAFGSDGALADELRNRRVGGWGRLHIFHLPEGPAMLQLSARKGSRRNSLSSPSQLREGMHLTGQFPRYVEHDNYVNPLDKAGRAVENLAVAKITNTSVMAYLKRITAASNTRSFKNPQASEVVQRFLQEEFEHLGYATCRQVFGRGGPSTNIVAYAPGSANGSELVVVGAHYDSRPYQGQAPGAEDNGSGLAALLDIMRAFREAGVRPVRGVAFVAFAGEEVGLLGSDAFAGALLEGSSAQIPRRCLPPALPAQGGGSAVGFLHRRLASAKHKTDGLKAIIMDEVGWLSPSLDEPTVNLESYDWTAEVMENLAQSNKDHNGPSLKVVHSSNPFGSDHMSFLDRNIPAVLTINGDDEAYPYYHDSRDEISSVSGSFVAKIAKMNLGGLLRLAGVSA